MTEQRAKRQISENWGRWAETLALWSLRVKGYRTLARRVRLPVGEIDIIARRGRTIVFVEVKARRQVNDAIEAFTPRQQERVYQAAALWVGQNPNFSGMTMRFDLIAISKRRWPRHLKNVIQP